MEELKNIGVGSLVLGGVIGLSVGIVYFPSLVLVTLPLVFLLVAWALGEMIRG